MSLDVYLTSSESAPKPARIFVRKAGANMEISRAKWDEMFPGTEPVAVVETESTEVYWSNITHNLGDMASEAGIYEALWRPDEIGITKARQLVEPLGDGLALLITDPDRFKKLNPPNGWGDYDGLVSFVTSYRNACVAYPDADVRVSR